jgi:hypothetical protein
MIGLCDAIPPAAWHFMWAPLMRIPCARNGSWILFPSCRTVPALGVMLCNLFLPPLLSWLGLLLRMPRCLWFHVCLLLGSSVALCLLSRCRLRVAGRSPLLFRPASRAEAEARLGQGVVPDSGFFHMFHSIFVMNSAKVISYMAIHARQ